VTDSVNTQSGDASNLSGDTLAVAISRDGKCEVALWSVSSGNRLDSRQVSLEGKPIAVGPKGKTVVVADTNGTVILWDVARDHEIARPLPASVEEIRLDPEAPEASRKRDVLARFSPDGRRLAVGLNEGAFPARGSVTVWNVDRGAQLGNALVQPGGVESLAFTEDGQTLAVSGRTVMLWDIGPRRQGTHVLSALGDGGPSIAWSPDDRRLASGGDSGKVVLWDARSGQKLKEIVTGLKEQVLGIQFADDTILRVGDASGAIILWNLERGRRKGPPGGRPGEVDTLRFSPDGKLAISTRGSGTSVWGLAQGRELMRLPPALTSPDGRAVLWSVEDNDQVVVWDAVGDRRWQFTLPKEGLLLAAFALSPDENSLAIAGGIGQGRTWIWDLAHRRISGNALATTFGALGSNIAFSPDGKTLASSGATGPDSAGLLHDVISLWDVNTRQRLGQPLEAGVGSVNQLAWSHDGRRLASTGFLFTTPGGVAVWDASVESWQELACQVAGRNLSADEWAMAMPGLPYHQTCPGLPVMDYYTPRPPPNEADTSASPENRTPLSP
jgi:WD40 repeat protein